MPGGRPPAATHSTPGFLISRDEWEDPYMEQTIITTMANWKEATGWELWHWEEGVADQLKLPNGTGPDYNRFKRAMDKVISAGFILRRDEERKMAKATWVITSAGEKEAERIVREKLESKAETPVEGEPNKYVGKWIKTRIPRDVYRELIRRFEAGELEMAFRTPKS